VGLRSAVFQTPWMDDILWKEVEGADNPEVMTTKY